jgi:hypothetical protein
MLVTESPESTCATARVYELRTPMGPSVNVLQCCLFHASNREGHREETRLVHLLHYILMRLSQLSWLPTVNIC